MSVERIQVCSSVAAHGSKGNSSWTLPKIVSKSDQASRADQGNTIKASEYLDEQEVLEEKVSLLAAMLKNAKCCTAYTGAGLSRAAGIGDYASKSNSITAGVPKLKSNYDAEPTYAHRILVALERAGYLHHYVQQNHDGLPQKAGFPQEKINEIHGAWYDPSNPVVQFSGNLRSDFYDWMIEKEKETDLCLCLGTSLSGMNADRMAETPALRCHDESKGLGTVIINLQKTRLDGASSLRIWAKLDDTFKLLAEKLDLNVDPISIDPPMSYGRNKFIIPYDKNGKYDANSRMVWNLQDHQKFVICNPEASNYKKTGEIIKQDNQGHYIVHVGRSGYKLGKWWPKCLMEGKWPFILPLVNINPEFLPQEDNLVEDNMVDEISAVSIVQTAKKIDEETIEWTLSVHQPDCCHVKNITYQLHPTFTPSTISINDAPFKIRRTGWGTFSVGILITLHNGCILQGTHELNFSQSESINIIE